MLINDLKAYSIMINASKKDRQKSKGKKFGWTECKRLRQGV